VAGAMEVWVIIDPEGTTETCFAWELGITSNNKEEAYALWQGLNIAKDIGAHLIKVVKDSRMIINHMVKKTSPRDNLLASILDRSRQLEGFFSYIQYYHVLREYNKEADRWEKARSNQKEGEHMVIGVSTHKTIP
jgi:ribonuclease HI